jgi:hypothetical protein
MSNQVKKQRFSFRKLILWGTGIFLLVCSVSPFLLWYLPLDPVSPPATQLGKEPAFDELLASDDKKWSFLFRKENKIVATDIYGGNEKVVLDITTATDNVNSRLLYSESISPDGRLLAVNYSNERDLSDHWDPIIGKLIVFDLRNSKVENIPTSLDGFEFDWTSPVYWLSSSIMLVKMDRPLGKDMFSEEIRFLRYDLQSIESFQVIEFNPCSFTATMKPDTHVLLLASDCDLVTQSAIYAIDTQGKRFATVDEAAYFKKFYFDCDREESCMQNLSSKDGPLIKVEPVTGDMVDGFGRWYDNNWYRDYVYLNDKPVRVSDGWIEFDPVWDSELRLFTWNEGYQTFQMDNQGNYRFWFPGIYVGKIPKNN